MVSETRGGEDGAATDWAGGGEVSPEGGVSSLDQLAALIGRAPIDALLGDIHAAAKGEPARQGDEKTDLVKHRVPSGTWF